MHTFLSTTLVALTLIQCSGAAPDDGGTTPTTPMADACGVPRPPELPLCEGALTEGPTHVVPLQHELATGATLDATWSPAEPGLLHLTIGGALETVSVSADPTPLNDLLADGDSVRVHAEDGAIRVERPDGTLLFEERTNERTETDPVPPSIAGFDRTMTPTSTCELVVEYSTFCLPMIVRFFSIEVAGESGPVVVAPRQTAEVTTDAGTFAVTNVDVYRGIHSEREGCSACAPAFAANARIGVVRVR